MVNPVPATQPPAMPAPAVEPEVGGFLARGDLASLLVALHADGLRVIGPTVSDGAVVYDEIREVADLPVGWHVRQAPGSYRLERRDDGRVFDYVIGPTAWKRFTFPPVVPLAVARRTGEDGREISRQPVEPDARPLAFLGVRACEIAAILVQDRVLLGGPAVDGDYRARRAAACIVAVECTTAADTCFCTSMGTGPEVTGSFDLALTELADGFLVRIGTSRGRAIAGRLPLVPASGERVASARTAVAAVRAGIGRPVASEGLPARLLAALDSPRWATVAERCLACANCTLVCPTCFCTSVGQVADLDGTVSTSERRWDSCFNPGFAQVAGGNFRPRVRDRYRQWLTHKFATWTEQFGTSGCVGCGRCITWCPVGIDVRAELLAIAPPTAPAVPLAVVAPPTAPAVEPIRQAYLPARVTAVRRETADVVTLHLATSDPALLATRPGGFVMASLPAFSAAPISVSRVGPEHIELTIRAAGPTTAALIALGRGDTVSLRGPLGRGWPVEAADGKDVVIVTGGIGLAPLRPLIDAVVAGRERHGAVRIYYGARTPRDLLYRDELAALAARDDLDVQLIVDRAGPEWLGRVGIVTHLFDRATWDGSRAVAFVCGPERMMQATAETLAERGVGPERVFVTLERHMDCGVGLCGHCQMGRFFVCRDGPVFSLAELGDTFGREGI